MDELLLPKEEGDFIERVLNIEHAERAIADVLPKDK
jgi:hypothetical protein